MNLLLNSWDVPTVNFLGAVDDGTGKWARGFWFDSLHPNAAGHVEITRTFVPTLFEALERGKPMPKRVASDNFAHLTPGDLRIAFSPPDPVHPFAFGFTARAQQNGTVATINGNRLDITIEPKKLERGGRTTEFESATFTTNGTFVSGVIIDQGRWAYRSATVGSSVPRYAPIGAWHQILLSHYTARGQTLLFVDGKLAGSIDERLEPTRFALGGTRHSTRAISSSTARR